MAHLSRKAILTLVAAAALSAQAQDPQPRFEAAGISVSAAATDPATFASGGVLRGGRYDLRKATMLDLIRTAWNIDPDAVFGGPNWLEFDRFDVAAKAPPNTRPETLRLMLQDLLKERFGLVVHEDTRPAPAFALSRGKNKPKLTESNGSGPGTCELDQQASATAQMGVYSCRNMTMEQFAPWLSQSAGAYLTIPVVNQTGLEGAWDFDLKWNGRAQPLSPDAKRITVFDAVNQQLGLMLEMKSAPALALVVDRVNEKPTPDPPGTEKQLPPRNDQFEVADFKMSRPGETLRNSLTSTHFEAQATVLVTFISYAFDIGGRFDDLVSGLPQGLRGKQYDFNAKLPADTSGDTRVYNDRVYRDDDLRLMMRNLLIERLGIKYHYEDRPVTAYSLVGAKPKMKTADPSHRSSCKEARVVANDPRDSNPRLNRLIDCQNVTMAQFAEVLQGLSPDYFATPVEDATGIQGAYDFTLSFTNFYMLMAPAAGDASSASDPNGGLSLPDAVSKQLGLKLEKRKRSVPILVIDHIEEKPTEN